MLISGATLSGGKYIDLPTIPEILSPAGQAAYAAASVGSFYQVSAADYATVAASLPNTSKIGMTDAQTNEADTGQWSGTYAITLPQANATLPVNNYYLGFLVKMSTSIASTTLSIYAGTTYRGAYSVLSGPTASISASGFYYFLCKKPTIQTSTKYISIYSSVLGGGMVKGTTSFAGAYAASPFSSWTSQTGGMPIFQSLITTTAT